MKTKILLIAIVMFSVALFAEVASAGPGRHMGYGYGYGVPPVANLTPEQATKLQAIQQRHLKDVAPLQQQLLAKKLELRSMWLSPNPDQAKINALQRDILNLQSRIQEKTTNARLEMRRVLTPEQQSQLAFYGYGPGYGKGKMGGHMGRW